MSLSATLWLRIACFNMASFYLLMLIIFAIVGRTKEAWGHYAFSFLQFVGGAGLVWTVQTNLNQNNQVANPLSLTIGGVILIWLACRSISNFCAALRNR